MIRALLASLLNLALAFAAAPSPADQKPETESKQTNPTLALPGIEQILDKYVQAIGGKTAQEKMTSRMATGEWENITRGVRFPIEIYAKAPNKRVELLGASENSGITGRGYDGTVGWSMNMLETGLRQVEGTELSIMQREADFYLQIRLKQSYKEMIVRGKEKLKGRDVYTVEAMPERGSPETMYFDAETGLLVRRDIVYESPYGKLPVRQYYEDYREVDGIKLPFTIRSEGEVTVQTKLKDVRHNLQLDDTKFSQPKSR